MKRKAAASLWRSLSFTTLLLISTSLAHAASGDRDMSFGTDGTSYISFGAQANHYPIDAELQTDGKMVILGQSISVSMPYIWTIGLARLNEDGTPDTSFGSGGLVDLSSYTGYYALSIKIQNDGKILVPGYIDVDGDYVGDSAILRLNANGSIDTSFGAAGLVQNDFGSGNDDATSDVTVQSDGKIVATGYAGLYGDNVNMFVARYNTNGTLDTSFSEDGLQFADFAGSIDEWAYRIGIQSNGKIIISGIQDIPINNWDVALARFNTDGTADNSFGTGGTALFALTSEADSGDMIILADDSILMTGENNYAWVDGDAFMMKLTPNGALDNSFGTGGIVQENFGAQDGFSSARIQQDGKIVATGNYTQNSPVGPTDPYFDKFMVVRYNANGSRDASFGESGVFMHDFGVTWEQAYVPLIQSDGRIVVMGMTIDGADTDLGKTATIRLYGDSAEMSVEEVENPAALVTSQQATHNLLITNNGPGESGQSRLTIDLADEAELLSVSSSQGSCTDADPIVCTIGIVPEGAQVTVTYSTSVPAPGTWEDIVSLNAGQVFDATLSNNTATLRLVIPGNDSEDGNESDDGDNQNIAEAGFMGYALGGGGCSLLR